MENKYDYAVGYGGKIIFKGKNLFNGGPNYKVFYTGLKGWKENDDYGLTGDISWIVSEDEALKAALNLGMPKEEFYK